MNSDFQRRSDIGLMGIIIQSYLQDDINDKNSTQINILLTGHSIKDRPELTGQVYGSLSNNFIRILQKNLGANACFSIFYLISLSLLCHISASVYLETFFVWIYVFYVKFDVELKKIGPETIRTHYNLQISKDHFFITK